MFTRKLTDDQDVIQLFNAIDFREQLVNNGVVNSGISCYRAALFANGVNFVENYYVQSTVWTCLQNQSINLSTPTKIMYLFLLFFSISE